MAGSATIRHVRYSNPGGGGSYAHGDSITITGTGFGSSPALAFAGGNQGPIETTTVGSTPANTLGGVNPTGAASNTDDSPAGTVNSWHWKRFSHRLVVASDGTRGKVVGGSYNNTSGGPDVAMEYRFPGTIANSGKIYTSFWTKNSYSPGSSGQHKILRLCGGTVSDISDSATNFVYTNQEFNGSAMMLSNTGNGTAANRQTWYNATNSSWNDSNAWQRTEIFLQMSSGSGVKDGQIFIRNFLGSTVPTSADPTATDGDGNPTSENLNSEWLSRPSSELMMAFLFENYFGNSFTDMTIFQDDYFINTTNWRRVEVWNSLTPSSATVRETQEPTSWSSTSITVRLNQGGLSAGSYYLVVLDDSVTDTVLASQAITIV